MPLKWKPGEDRLSKLLLSVPEFINLVVHSLVGYVFYFLYKDMVCI